MANPQSDVELLIQKLLPQARRMIVTNKGFFPFAGYFLDQGKVQSIFVDGVGESTDSDAVIGFLEEKLQAIVGEENCRATAIVTDVKTIPPGKKRTVDAVCFALDHHDPYSMIVFLPYRLDKDGELTFGDLFALEGEDRIFPRARKPARAGGVKVPPRPKPAARKTAKK